MQPRDGAIVRLNRTEIRGFARSLVTVAGAYSSRRYSGYSRLVFKVDGEEVELVPRGAPREGRFRGWIDVPSLGRQKICVEHDTSGGKIPLSCASIVVKEDPELVAFDRQQARGQRRAQRACQRLEGIYAAIPYNKLKRNTDAYVGSSVRFKGEVGALQYPDAPAARRGAFLLQRAKGADVWVDPAPGRGPESGDSVTVYGTVVGLARFEVITGRPGVPSRTGPSTGPRIRTDEMRYDC